MEAKANVRSGHGANGAGKVNGGGGTTAATRQSEAAESAADAAIEAAEHLTRDLARVRARFGMDLALAPRSLAAAWTPPTALTEDDEAEFVDAVADCLGAGLSLGVALDCWDSGDLAYDAAGDDASADEEWSPFVVAATVRPAPGRRLFVR